MKSTIKLILLISAIITVALLIQYYIFQISACERLGGKLVFDKCINSEVIIDL